MITVSATDSADLRTSWSRYGSYVTLSAPGLNIYCTNPGGSYGQCWGTSFSAPVVAATAALMMSAKPTLSSTQVESLLYSTATDLGTAGRDIYYGYGRVNAAAAVSAAVGTVTPTADTTAPTASISAPLGSATVSGLVPVNVTAADNVGVSKVELRVNGSTVATDTATPFAFSWNSASVANGIANLTAVAYDAAGNVRTSAAVAVNVANTTVAPTTDTTAPVVTITSPKAGGVKAKGTLTITSSASDNSGAAGVLQTLYIDSIAVATAAGSSLTYSWNLSKAASGAHTIKVVAIDAAKNSATASEQVTK